MRLLSFLCLTLLISGCASSSPDVYERGLKLQALGLNNMPGIPVLVLTEMYGEPESIMPLATGDTGYTWNNYAAESVARYDNLQKSDLVDRYCKLDVVARNGLVVKADTEDNDYALACNKFYSDWRVYQVTHPSVAKL